MPLRGRQVSPYRLYLFLECATSFLLGISYATVTVYWVAAARLNPLQLLLLGTSLELSYFVFQLPTGVLADLVSRRLCVLFDSGGQILGGPVVGAIGTLASVRIALLAGAAALGPAAACIAAASGRIRPVSGPDDEEEGVPIGNPV